MDELVLGADNATYGFRANSCSRPRGGCNCLVSD
jgi:hypothetical protein